MKNILNKLMGKIYKMNLEQLFKNRNFKRYSAYQGDLESDIDGSYCRFSDFETIYYEQKNIIDGLLGNSESQTETNQVVIDRLYNIKKLVSSLLTQAQIDFDYYEDSNELQFGYLEGKVDTLKKILALF